MPQTEPLVSVIIPTINRPKLVVRAVRSALDQTLEAIEVIVVVDGPDEATLQALKQIIDSRLRVKPLPQNVGQGAAQMAGVRQARGTWVAFLDDDDEWLPQKLELQLQTAQQSARPYPIVSCRILARTEVGDGVWPRRLPQPNEHLSEYLFCPKSLFEGPVLAPMIQTSTHFTKREFLEKVPIRRLRMVQDVDWLLRANTMEGVGVEFVSTRDPLVICHFYTCDPLGTSLRWRFANCVSLIRTNRHLVTSRAYASFLMTRAAGLAAQAGDPKAILWCLQEALRYGRLTVVSTLLYLWIGFVPWRARRKFAMWFVQQRSRRQHGA
ncbi:MAG: glycosyltransferase family 2 protein [Ardenticatenia bacterium]|nr:glycosyltransferase family 2 protein [Ardenticatenia bacterium]